MPASPLAGAHVPGQLRLDAAERGQGGQVRDLPLAQAQRWALVGAAEQRGDDPVGEARRQGFEAGQRRALGLLVLQDVEQGVAGLAVQGGGFERHGSSPSCGVRCV
ncbi:MAG: hypothetical protein HOV87_17945 [Catenulispora sp.]|nr:hypothetical protein [Catenulispora sp.]